MQSFFASGTFSIKGVRLDRHCVYLVDVLSDRCGQSACLEPLMRASILFVYDRDRF